MQCTKNPGQAFMKYNHFIKYCHNPGEISYPSFSISSNIVTILEKSLFLSSPVLPDLRGPAWSGSRLPSYKSEQRDWLWLGWEPDTGAAMYVSSCMTMLTSIYSHCAWQSRDFAYRWCPIRHPTSGGQVHGQESAVHWTFHLVKSKFLIYFSTNGEDSLLLSGSEPMPHGNQLYPHLHI